MLSRGYAKTNWGGKSKRESSESEMSSYHDYILHGGIFDPGFHAFIRQTLCVCVYIYMYIYVCVCACIHMHSSERLSVQCMRHRHYHVIYIYIYIYIKN